MMASLDKIDNVHVSGEQQIISPAKLRELYPAGADVTQTIIKSRNTVSRIIQHKDPRVLVISGPCSIHDMQAAKEYACRLKALHDAYKENLYIVMRVYFEKPRTIIGWKGFINDPHLDDSFEVEQGLHNARELLLFLADLELPAATEALDPMTPQYLSDLISWVAVGARTTESQVHREMASGLSMPVGFKNGTDGNIKVAVNAMKSATSAHRFLGINSDGCISLINSTGNPHVHLILRGGVHPNYTRSCVNEAEQMLGAAGLSKSIVVDCSHGNAESNFKRQAIVAENVGLQIREGSPIVGVMLESHLNEGKQSVSSGKDDLQYGVSITDACIGWEETRRVIFGLNENVSGIVADRVYTLPAAEMA